MGNATHVDFSQVTEVMRGYVFPMLLETFIYALYTVLNVTLVYRQCVNREAAPLSPFILWTTLVMFTLFSLYWATDVYLLWAEVYLILPLRETTSSLQGVYWNGVDSGVYFDGIVSRFFVPTFVQYIVQLHLVVLGDIISLWRAYAILGRPRWLYRLLIGIVIIEHIVYAIVYAGSAADYLVHYAPGIKFLANERVSFTLAAYLITALAQLTSTSLIAYKAWAHWKDIKEYAQQSNTRSGLAMLAVVIESGVVYFALLAWFGAIDVWGPPNSIVTTTTRFYMSPLIAMYPTLVVVLVAMRRSMLERSVGPATAGLSGVLFATHASASMNAPMGPLNSQVK